MKKHFKYMSLFMLITFLFAGDVYADEGFTLTATADKTSVVVGKEATVSLKLKSNESSGISTCQFSVTPDSGITITSKSSANNWTATTGTSYILESGNTTGLTPADGETKIYEFKFKVDNNGSVKFSSIKCANATKEWSQSDIKLDFTTTEAASDTSLSSLVATGGTISPEFGKATSNSYTLALTTTTFSLEATASNSAFQDKIVFTDIDKKVLNPSSITFSSNQGAMPIFIVVNGDTENQYTIMAAYTSTLDNSLATLSINGKAITLEPNKKDYEITVSRDTTKLNVEATLKDSTNFEFAEEGPAQYTMNSESMDIPLIINPKSTTTGGTSMTYTITVKKEGAPSSSSSSSSDAPSSTTYQPTPPNPETGSNIASFAMALVIMISLVISFILYRKNMESYK